MKIPDPTKIPSIPIFIINAASAGVAIPPAEKVMTGNLPNLIISSVTFRTPSLHSAILPNGILLIPGLNSDALPKFINLSEIKLIHLSNESSSVSCMNLISSSINLACLTADTIFPVPASPFVRIIAAPSKILRIASPRLVAPQTNGIVNSFLGM